MPDTPTLPVPEVALARLRAARRVFALTGAGISAESGVPTFRGRDNTGFWGRYDPQQLASERGYREDPRRGWAWYAMRRAQLRGVAPNAGHRALARLEARYQDFTLATQNVDGLHARAGSRNVVELHGAIAGFRCLEEGAPVEYADPAGAPVVTEEAMERGEWPEVPRCPRCGGLLRPDVVWFGEALPLGAWARAERAAERCDVCLVVGTSAEVWPAAGLPLTARRHGALVVEVNPDRTELTHRAGLSLRGPAGVILPQLADLIG